MKTAVLNNSQGFVDALHSAICSSYGCGIGALCTSAETLQVKTAVFLLNHFYGVSPQDIGPLYVMQPWRVEHIVESVKAMYPASEHYRNRIKQILDAMDAAEKEYFTGSSSLLDEILKC